MPEALVLGYLRNQRLVDNLRDIASIQVDWEVSAAAITTVYGDAGQRCADMLRRRTVTAGCGQGTQFGDQLERLVPLGAPDAPGAGKLARSTLFMLFEQVRGLDTIYKRSGAVHGCVLADAANDRSRILHHVEDIGRHNAVDSISGLMWMEHAAGADKVFYTTGRLTSEMVIKVVEMGIPILVSRSGTTEMGLDVARRCGVTLIGRARNERFVVFNGADRIDFQR
jgi:FdhD protein